MTEWKVGMEAVFIGWPKDCALTEGGPPPFEENRVYTVEQVYLAPPFTPFRRLDGTTGFTRKRLLYLKIKGVYGIAHAFRPVIKRKTSIEVFHELRRGVERVVKRGVDA